MHHEHSFYAGLINSLEDPKRFLLNNFDRYKPIRLPYDPSIELLDYESETIITKNSYTKPVIITFDTNVGKKKYYLRENVSLMI